MTQTAHTFEPDAPALTRLNYWLHVPDSYHETPAWPLVLFLHGSGERGDDLALVKKYGLPPVLDSRPDLPFLAVSPQCPRQTDWTPHFDTLLALIDAVCAAYHVDADRIYLTGLSMGGRGAWHLAVLHPHRFAALASICARVPDLPNFLERVCVLNDLPIWVFHGAQDDVVPVENAERIVAALRACGGQPRLTIYPDADHDSWTPTYADLRLYEWLLAQRRRTSAQTHEQGSEQ